MNGTTGCPYEDKYIKTHGGPSSILIGNAYCCYQNGKIVSTGYKATK